MRQSLFETSDADAKNPPFGGGLLFKVYLFKSYTPPPGEEIIIITTTIMTVLTTVILLYKRLFNMKQVCLVNIHPPF